MKATSAALNPNLRENPGIIQAHDASGSFGGPIVRDRLWFYGSYRTLDTQTALEGITANANAGDASRWDWRGSPIAARLVQDRQMIIGHEDTGTLLFFPTNHVNFSCQSC